MTEEPELPDRVRQRVVALVSDVLPSLAPLPSTLRKVADFAPARRARLGGTAIWAALEDDEFRNRAAVQVAARPSPTEDDLTLAATAWLERADGWEDTVADVVRRQAEEDEQQDRASGEIDRLRSQISTLQQQARDQAVAHREVLEATKAENTTLRRRLGEARSATRAVEAERDSALAAREDAERTAASIARSSEQEVRRLRTQLEEASAATTTEKREARSERDQATVRARYLLDALSDAATGLRRELGLPATGGAPGDAVEGALLGEDPVRTTGAPASPAVLEQLLGLPKARLVIDGYNVTKQAWQSATLEAQRSRLVASLASLVARTGAETTVVFDAANSAARPVVPAPRGVKVVFSPVGVIADDVIRQLVAAEPQGRVVVVVTSDQAVARDVMRQGARAIPASTLIDLLGR